MSPNGIRHVSAETEMNPPQISRFLSGTEMTAIRRLIRKCAEGLFRAKTRGPKMGRK